MVRLWNKLDMQELEPSSCWLWTGHKDPDGYGRIRAGGRGKYRVVLTHRLAYALAHGPFQHGLVVRHTCDTPACCNPSHLVLGTHLDNQADKVRRGRHLWGEQHNGARLTEAQVLEIRAGYVRGVTRQQDIAETYGITQTCVSRIITRRSWAHI